MGTGYINQPVVVIFDCGATSIRAVAVDSRGTLLATESEPNDTIRGAEDPRYHIWPFDLIWAKLCRCSCRLLKQRRSLNVAGIAVTTFGVDGTLVEGAGDLRYPVISWRCPRTEPVMTNIGRYMDLEALLKITGLGNYSFNTLYKLIWLKENRPDLIHRSSHFLFLSSLINYRLTGRMTTDWTMLGTSMLTDRSTQHLSRDILGQAGLEELVFPECIYPGQIIGGLTGPASAALGISVGTPVISCGHDTQFALFGSGAGLGEPVLSSGTWEVLMVRTGKSEVESGVLESSVTTEFDVARGQYNLGVHWLASGLIENVRAILFSDEERPDVYETMIDEANRAASLGDDVVLPLDLLADPAESEIRQIKALESQIGRGGIYRSVLLQLSSKLKRNFDRLNRAGNLVSQRVRVVGGGARNRLWNRMKAEALGIPIHIIKTGETTVLGAAFFAMEGAQIFSSAEEARSHFEYQFDVIDPRQTEVKQ